MSDKIESEYVSDHFKWSEFACTDGTPVPKKYRANVEKLAANLEVLRAFLGNEPLSLSSAYRTPAHNRAVGGASKSQHLVAKAGDIQASHRTPSQVYGAIKYLIKKGKMDQGGLGKYNTFTHYDVRGYKARW